ncbi:MAG: hypothetical protein PHV30_11570 [Candidatus Margulisbacteria bacterium]|nr:hypothetical protein [Candidatus Margulisiibacteriota bacterium]
MKKILLYGLKDDWQYQYLKQKLGEGFILDDSRTISETKFADYEVVCIFINTLFNDKEIKKFPALKFITTRSTGYDHISLEYAKSKGIIVANVPAYGDNTVAEHTFALILSLSRNLRKAYLNILHDDFLAWKA